MREGDGPESKSGTVSRRARNLWKEREHGVDVYEVLIRCSCGACMRADCVLATNIEIGNQMPTILPARSLAAPAIKTAMQTHQLHMIALTTVGMNAPEHFFMAVVTASS